jgi:hypothetical protein
MIYDAEDLLDEFSKKYPQIKKRSLRKIFKKGFTEIRKHLLRSRDVGVGSPDIIFFIPQTPEKQGERVSKKLGTDKFIYEKANRK